MLILKKFLLWTSAISAIVGAVKVRAPAPEWKGEALMPDGSFQSLSHIDFLGKYYILVFYPLDFTFVCPTELRAYSEAAKELAELDVDLIGVSVDSKFVHLAWTETPREDGGVGKLDIPLIADVTKQISKDFDILAADDDELAGIAMRGTYIIDPQGTLRAYTIHDEPLGRSVEETIRAVKGLIYADSHQGEGCPANWEPGASTIKANPTDSKEFFKQWA
uniref:Thioredoxin domain-containing protein n=1 Tax=Aureoumbra lagunensis TaxID=44058 RepID=A0A7S3NQY3_9STRA|mmetsp:Transcript_23214/g.27915  ORF Transcript_23214/g.27915 Transcript_23214/m.27915 type:complete len:220 (-) Transcript_23214:157-816(-)|eukprot:CAMPEP_0197290092 /NCGR_PEP_ID=MMETSP0890-20130614/7332_1 /TAXON_ID=44058 ORGANISM="Aureoumbra lagunensis, Strain CCMP1510" /NCGR_SAMPLE_ID=MMETSP0890 /ASSEMBLY_ACC=CAM_ASM_000533 /LENGTH=219 /DNA_ID=CAMNT_0042761893 /DNA_START=23 /DNA_END=682 /DNA_ORIENTATION=-